MTRKDFVLIAAALKRARQAALDQSNLAQASGVVMAAQELADEFAEQHDRFNRGKFLAAVVGEA